jgi:hypothetical protein
LKQLRSWPALLVIHRGKLKIGAATCVARHLGCFFSPSS